MSNDTSQSTTAITSAVRNWVEAFVVGLNMCPFARRELVSKRIQFSVSEARTQEALLADLEQALTDIHSNDSIETTLLIHPHVLQDFHDYNQFLDYADALLVQMNLEGVYQIASFHPDYQFADLDQDDIGNYTNRSPYPILHLLCEDSIEAAVAKHPDSDLIPERNQALLKDMGLTKLQTLLRAKL